MSMDTWTEKQIKIMGVGGNKNLLEFLKQYDLNEEAIQTKYQTNAARYYRNKVLSEFIYQY